MCGIAGVAGAEDQRRAAAKVRRMLEVQARRGPDGEGVQVWPGAVLGHRRLSIFDLSDAGRQPMLSGDAAVGVVFNGAIYNFPLLRRELEQRGRRFRSQTDTEVLVHGYLEWGLDELVARLRGMFAFGLWDAGQEKLWLVRDRLGVKPLHFSIEGKTIAFASTVPALAEAGFGSEIDDQAVAEFLEYGFVTDERSIYRETSKLGAGSILEWSRGTARMREYWRAPRTPSRPSIGFEEAVEETERLFLAAVERRLAADVPVGALLSGGVDSSLVCWGISRLGADITAYTVGVPGSPIDETADAVATAGALKIRHRVLPLSAPDDALLDDLTAAYGEPFACGSALGVLRVCQAMRESAKVVLTGDGGDDVFLGYPWLRLYLRTAKIARLVPEPAARAWRAARLLIPPWGPARRVRNLVNYVTGGLGAVAAARPGLPALARAGILGDRLRMLSVPERSLPGRIESARNLLAEYLDYFLKHQFVGEFMPKVDGGAMYHGLEARAPFLDQELWEFAASLPFEIRLHRGELKAVLREIARRRIGARVAGGRKRGFGVPVEEWLAGRWNAAALALFENSRLARAGYVRDEAVRHELRRARRRGAAPTLLWHLFVLERWLRQRPECESRPVRRNAE
jgi:asparagine synthase (glutamine-hydrolysing)